VPERAGHRRQPPNRARPQPDLRRPRAGGETSQARRWVRESVGYDQPDIRGTVIDNVVDAEACEDARVRKEMTEVFTGRTAPERVNKEIHRACAVR
jgi:hypothetical protein